VTWNTQPTERGFRVVAILSVFNEADIVGQAVRHLIGQGVHVYIIDTGSTDETLSVIRNCAGQEWIEIEEWGLGDAERQPFEWRQILQRKEALAANLDADWFIHHDADEFRESPWPGVTLCDALKIVDSNGYNAVDFEALTFPPTHNGFERDQDVLDAFRYWEAAQSYDQLRINAWKSHASVDISSSGGHDVGFPDRRVFPIKFILRHYPVRTQEQGERKVFVERKPRFATSERELGWHVQYDGIEPGHSFIRLPSSLQRYEHLLTRAHLVARDVEALDRSNAESAATNGELWKIVGELRSEVGLRERAADDARHALEIREAELTTVREQLVEKRLETDSLTKRLEDERKTVEAFKQSWSWRLTAPLRALGRLFVRS